MTLVELTENFGIALSIKEKNKLSIHSMHLSGGIVSTGTKASKKVIDHFNNDYKTFQREFKRKISGRM